MDSLLLVLGTIFLVVTCIVLTLLVLMQRPASSGMGSAISGGDGIAESAFGTESSKVLRKLSIYAIVLFFVLCFVLYLGHIVSSQDSKSAATDVLDLSSSEAETTIEVEEPAVSENLESVSESVEAVEEETGEIVDDLQGSAESVQEEATEAVENLETISLPEPSTK